MLLLKAIATIIINFVYKVSLKTKTSASKTGEWLNSKFKTRVCKDVLHLFIFVRICGSSHRPYAYSLHMHTQKNTYCTQYSDLANNTKDFFLISMVAGQIFEKNK